MEVAGGMDGRVEIQEEKCIGSQQCYNSSEW